jgi:hypothetical protein
MQLFVGYNFNIILFLYVYRNPINNSWKRDKAQWSLYVPPDLTFTNPTFYPHSVFMCFVWISEQTAIISLYNINWLVCITETECGYCAVRAESLYTWYYLDTNVRSQVFNVPVGRVIKCFTFQHQLTALSQYSQLRSQKKATCYWHSN